MPRLPDPAARRARRSAILCLLLLTGLCCPLRGTHAEDDNLHIFDVRNGDHITVRMEAKHCLEATVTVTAELKNMTATPSLPLTMDTRGGTSLTLVTFRPTDPTKEWHYDYHWDWKCGRRASGQPVPPYLYALPYKDGPHRIMQAAHGTYSHGPGSQDEEAVDFEMPVGTKICAARDGVVVAWRADCTRGGPDKKYKKDFNYVILRHEDGTFAEYAHLKQDGVRVLLGEHVKAGQTIGISGFTGFTSAPHLHFVVYNTVNGALRVTLPVQFRGSDNKPFRPEADHMYVP